MVTLTRNEALTLMSINNLIINEEYLLIEPKIQLIANTKGSFSATPLLRTKYALDFDAEEYDIRANQIIGIDHIGCVVRCINQVWNFVNDAGHVPKKIASVVNNGINGCKVNYTKAYTKVLNFNTSIDETYSASNLCVSCGASVGLTFAIILIHKTQVVNNIISKKPMTHLEATIPSSNIWVSGCMQKNIQL